VVVFGVLKKKHDRASFRSSGYSSFIGSFWLPMAHGLIVWAESDRR
jgi:hypothetical protein